MGTTYYFKAWAYSVAANGTRTYGRGVETSCLTTTVSAVRVNEFNGTGEQDAANLPINPLNQDTVEFFNPSGETVTFSGLRVANKDPLNERAMKNNLQILPRGYYTMRANSGNATKLNLNFNLNATSDQIKIRMPSIPNEVDDYLYTRNQSTTGAGATINPTIEGRVWDGGPRGKDFSYGNLRFECKGAIYRSVANSSQPTSLFQPLSNSSFADSANQRQQGTAPVKFLQATSAATGLGVYLHYVNLGEEPAVWSYSPKQQDFHPINVEGMAVKSQAEMVIGLRSPLSNRTTGNAYALVFNNTGNAMLPTGGWTAPASSAGGAAPVLKQLNLNGQGIRSVQWCPTLRNAADAATAPASGAYLIVGGAANGGPLSTETGREKFSLYRWDNINLQPVLVVADLAPFTVRPEGVNLIGLDGVDHDNNQSTPKQDQRRLIFVEDRAEATGYDTENMVHWPLCALNLQ